MDSQLGETVLNLLWHLAQEYLNWKTYETQHYTFEFFLILPLISKRFIRERNATTPEKWAISFSSSGVAFIRLALAGRKFHAESVWKKGDGRFANGILGVKVSRPVIMILDNHNRAFSELYMLRGDSYKARGQNDMAKAEYEKALLYNKHLKSAITALTS